MKARLAFFIITSALVAAPSRSEAAPIPPSGSVAHGNLSQRLDDVRAKILGLEQNLLSALQGNREARENIRRIQDLISLQKKEREIGQARIQEIESTIQSLEGRRTTIRERVDVEQRVVRKSLRDLRSLSDHAAAVPSDLEQEAIDQPRAHMLEKLVQLSLREIETLKIDLEDSQSLEERIQGERAQLEAMLNEMAEGEEILELNRQLQVDLLQKTHQERLSQLESYRKLKQSESQVSGLIQSFNARMELKETQQQERASQRQMYAMSRSEFARLKGKLGLPIAGSIVGRFGKFLDRETRLTVFKKGVDIQAGASQPVKSVYQGKVAFSGELQGYGRMVILDHGDHFYSLCGHLGALSKKVGDEVKSGEEIGSSSESGEPVYFEIRAHNIPVNPLQWVSL